MPKKSQRASNALAPLTLSVRLLMSGLSASSLLLLMPAAVQAQAMNEGEACLRPEQGTVSAIQEICSYSEGLAAFKLNGLWGYVDREGKVQIAPQFKQARAFSEGLAPVLERRRSKSDDCDCERDSDDGLWGFVDPKGQWVIAPEFDDAQPFSEGLSAVSLSGRGQQGTAFIDPQGRQPLATRFYRAQSFVGDRALVEISEGKQAFVTRSGQVLPVPKAPVSLPPDTQVQITQGRKNPARWLADLKLPARYMSMQGQVLMLNGEQRFEEPVSPEAVVVSVFQKHWRKGLMHASGRWLLPPEFSQLGDFENGVGIAMREGAPKQAVKPKPAVEPGGSKGAAEITPPAPPSIGGASDYAYFLVDAKGQLLTPAYSSIRRERGFYVAKSDGQILLLGARGERLSALPCAQDSYSGARAVYAEAGGWGVVNTCDGKYWVQGPDGRSWSGAGQVEGLRNTGGLLLLRFKDDAQLFNRQGKPLLSVSMRAQLKGLDRSWLTADEQSPSGKATRPQAIFSVRKDQGYEQQFYALTASGRWVSLPSTGRAELYWQAPRDARELAAPVVLRTAEGMGVLNAEARWLIKPERQHDFFYMPGGWVGQRGQAQQPDVLWSSSGQKLSVPSDAQAHVVAAGLNWLEREGHWYLLDARKVSVRALDGLDNARFVQAAGGFVVMARSESGDEAERPLQALYSTQGQRLSPWLRADYLQPILSETKTVYGWVASRAQDEAGTYSLLLSPQGKPVTQWLPLNMRAAEGRAVVFFGTAEGQGAMSPQGKVQMPALYGQVSVDKQGWLRATEGKWSGMLNALGRWIAVVPHSRGFAELAHGNVARLGGILDSNGVLDINGRHTSRVQASELALDTVQLPLPNWQVKPSPLPQAEQAVVNDAQPANWFVQGFRKGASVHDMQGGERLKSNSDQTSLNVLPASMLRTGEAPSSTDGQAHSRTELLNAQAQPIVSFDDAEIFANREGRLNLQSLQVLPAAHPLARPAVQQQRAADQGLSEAVAESGAVKSLQINLLDEANGQALGQNFDALGQLQQGRAPVSYMGNLGVADAQGQMVLQSAWHCGVVPVLLNRAGDISWPAELAGQAGNACPKD